MKEPSVSVGIVNAREMKFTLYGSYETGGTDVTGNQQAECVDGRIRWNGQLHRELLFKPSAGDCRFRLDDVTIGIHFHWERHEAQVFSGALKLMVVDDGKLCAVNILPVEEYLLSVCSSEMSATASLQFLKAQVVISRSWLLAQMQKRGRGDAALRPAAEGIQNDDMWVRWYDREAHTRYDVCADDHCQRYQGITRVSSPRVRRAVAETCGEVLQSGSEICDARFSKCCGGITEEFESCWEDVHHSYLSSRRDDTSSLQHPQAGNAHGESGDDRIRNEEEACRWILASPPAFCNTHDARILSQVLNTYDRETQDFYRWTVEYTTEELSALVAGNLQMDFGRITDLIPVRRGPSGRIILLKIVGTRKSLTIGKELEIRRVLSDTHLLSSAFVVEKTAAGFVLHGAGWGHGVGLCQIGAAVMGEQGYSYRDILLHYYPGADIVTAYGL